MRHDVAPDERMSGVAADKPQLLRAMYVGMKLQLHILDSKQSHVEDCGSYRGRLIQLTTDDSTVVSIELGNNEFGDKRHEKPGQRCIYPRPS